MREESEPNVGAAEQGAPPTAGTLFSCLFIFKCAKASSTRSNNKTRFRYYHCRVVSRFSDSERKAPTSRSLLCPFSSGLEVIFGYVIFVKT